ncbi:hypothetical protein HYR54_13630 [Candidatus Acetothermia bacterium]|nr:hypothetical protein [Candidatus Acetothermia bacterium]
MMRRSVQLHDKHNTAPKTPKSENPSFALSHEHASIFFDSRAYVCTTCGFYAERKEAVVDHIRKELGRELLGKEQTIH